MAQGVGEVDAQNPAVAEAGRFENVQFLYQLAAAAACNAKVMAKFADGSPLFLEERIGEGRVLTFAGMLDNSTSDFPLHASYLPFVAQSGLYLAGASDNASSFWWARLPRCAIRKRKRPRPMSLVQPENMSYR